MRSLKLKRVLITGAARGMGRAMADRFAAEGAEVILTDIDQAGLDQASDEIRATEGRCRAYRIDVTDDASIAEVRDRLHADAGRLDL